MRVFCSDEEYIELEWLRSCFDDPEIEITSSMQLRVVQIQYFYFERLLFAANDRWR